MPEIIMQWLESEKLRLAHLRDRASEKGRSKEYPITLKHKIVSFVILYQRCHVMLVI